MYESQQAVYKFMLGFLEMVTKDITEEEMDRQPFPGANSPRWILTHLAICCDYAAKALGGTRECPKEWHVAYGPGSSPNAEGIPMPTKDELLAALKSGHERVADLLSKASPDHMAKPHGVEFLKPTPLVTVADFVTHLMTSHEGGHIGQLSYWRRASGRDPII